MKKIGITGGIATGKSTVKQVLLKLGYPVLDCDEIVHQLLEEPKVIKKVADLFGPEVLMSNKINRQA